MTPLLPTIGQDFGEVGQKSSDAALSNLLLKYQKLHPVILTSPRPCLFLFLRHQNVSLNYRSGWWPLTLSSPSASGGKQLLQTQQTSTRPPNRLWAAIKYLLEHYVWLQSHYGTWTKGWGDKCRNKYLLSSKGVGLFVFTWVRHCSDEIVLVHKLSLILLGLPTLRGIYMAIR